MEKTQRYKIIIEYDGSAFNGWQSQSQGLGIQQCIEEAIYKFSKENVKIYGAGRTDTGVHALGQIAHFDLEKKIPLINIKNAINFYLKPRKISILSIYKTNPDFHARFSAKSRSYIYKIINRNSPLTLDDKKAWLVKSPLNYLKMNKAAQFLLGTHDFSSFRCSECQSNSAIKSITSIKVSKSSNMIKINITAPSFLHNQVRIIVGTLSIIGKKIWNEEKMLSILKAKDRKEAGPTAPPYGLYLKNVEY